jgi:hypothetical protein
MTSLRACAALGSALLALATATPAHAGWQSVFQVTCFGCSTPSVSSYYYGAYYAPPSYSSSYYTAYAAPVDPCAPPCPVTVATTRYVQRSFYEPCTTYKLETSYQPVTTYRTSYYWAPVTSYRYSCYYDPCTCSYRQVASPVTCYRLQSQCCPVTSYVQRCCYVPVTTYRQSFYWEPQTCYSLIDPCTGQPVPAGGAAVRDGSNPAVQEYKGTPAVPADPNYPQKLPEGGSRSSYQRNYPPVQAPPPEPVRPIAPKYNSIAFDEPARGDDANVVGRIVTKDGDAVKGRVRLLFVNDAATSGREESAADAGGKFRVQLTSGTWRVYLRDDRGQPVYHTQVTIADQEVRQMTLVSNKR